MSSGENLSDNNSNQDLSKEPLKLENIVLKPCHICGRTFNPQSLERHEKVCEKTKKVIPRNIFNSFSQRAKEIGAVPISNDAKEEDKKKCKKWKEEHENLLRVVRGAKNANLLNNGTSQLKIPAGYQQCPSCNRCFNQKAADRHISWCTEQQTRLPKTPPDSEALERLRARTKYRAPLPRKRENSDLNIRLIRSAESIREPSRPRTHSSPHIPVGGIKAFKPGHENSSNRILRSQSQINVDKSSSVNPNNNNNNVQKLNPDVNPEVSTPNKKAVKFKEIFPVYKKDRNKNLDMLAALRLRLSELGTSEDFSDDCFTKSNENEISRNQSKKCNFPSPASREIWTSDGEMQCSSTSSSSDSSLPSLPCAGSAEQRLPRFCYNCGTKYPVVSAKFCCECGTRRFVIGVNDNEIYP